MLLSFLIVTILTLSRKDIYVLNENAINGLEFSETMESIGFIDGDKILTANGKEIERVSSIIPQIVENFKNTDIQIEREGKIQNVVILEESIIRLIKEGRSPHIKPIMFKSTNLQEVIVSESRFGLSDVITTYSTLWKQVKLYISPRTQAYDHMGGFITISSVKSINGYFLILSLSLIFIAIINFIPLPGLDFGNMIISIVENIKKKRFNARKVKYAKILSLSAVTLIWILALFM